MSYYTEEERVLANELERVALDGSGLNTYLHLARWILQNFTRPRGMAPFDGRDVVRGRPHTPHLDAALAAEQRIDPLEVLQRRLDNAMQLLANHERLLGMDGLVGRRLAEVESRLDHPSSLERRFERLETRYSDLVSDATGLRKLLDTILGTWNSAPLTMAQMIEHHEKLLGSIESWLEGALAGPTWELARQLSPLVADPAYPGSAPAARLAELEKHVSDLRSGLGPLAAHVRRVIGAPTDEAWTTLGGLESRVEAVREFGVQRAREITDLAKRVARLETVAKASLEEIQAAMPEKNVICGREHYDTGGRGGPYVCWRPKGHPPGEHSGPNVNDAIDWTDADCVPEQS